MISAALHSEAQESSKLVTVNFSIVTKLLKDYPSTYVKFGGELLDNTVMVSTSVKHVGGSQAI